MYFSILISSFTPISADWGQENEVLRQLDKFLAYPVIEVDKHPLQRALKCALCHTTCDLLSPSFLCFILLSFILTQHHQGAPLNCLPWHWIPWSSLTVLSLVDDDPHERHIEVYHGQEAAPKKVTFLEPCGLGEPEIISKDTFTKIQVIVVGVGGGGGSYSLSKSKWVFVPPT